MQEIIMKKIKVCFIYLLIKTQCLGAGEVSLEHSRMMQHFGTEDSSNKQFYSNEKKKIPEVLYKEGTNTSNNNISVHMCFPANSTHN